MQCAAMANAARSAAHCSALRYPPHSDRRTRARQHVTSLSPLKTKELRDEIHRAALFMFDENLIIYIA